MTVAGLTVFGWGRIRTPDARIEEAFSAHAILPILTELFQIRQKTPFRPHWDGRSLNRSGEQQSRPQTASESDCLQRGDQNPRATKPEEQPQLQAVALSMPSDEHEMNSPQPLKTLSDNG